ncbi:uncharacterized protein LOC127901207 [Citrus sinensis]|uniref:uncharacterized protein LOC112100169 n=1 Tax=Citrus clementina TaxID=85681 RepID=UPI000CECEE81|nr:uncharacterized protein LOC112100169 [Citrus x clementina]XP_052293897.1 uncharacterized protein LOC127901207 [Citrus sinensis]
MSNRRRKLIADESDEETGDSVLNLSIPTDFLRPSSSVRPSHGRDTLEYPRPLAVSPSPELELVGNRGGPVSGSGENHSFGGVGVPEGLVPPPPLIYLSFLYNIPNEVLLVVPGKYDVPSRPPKGSVTMHLESFKLGARLPLQSYFARILGESWGFIKDLEDRPLLQVETVLVNASTCQDLLSLTNLVGSGLVDIAAGMDNKILSAMSRKRGRVPSSSSNLPPPPKKASAGSSKALVPTLPPPPHVRVVGRKLPTRVLRSACNLGTDLLLFHLRIKVTT